MKIQHKLTDYFVLLPYSAFLTGCEIDDQTDPNGPSLDSVANNASRTELNLLVGGIESTIRNGIRDYAYRYRNHCSRALHLQCRPP